jgi:hypothetical protein
MLSYRAGDANVPVAAGFATYLSARGADGRGLGNNAAGTLRHDRTTLRLNRRPELRVSATAAQTRTVSVARIRLIPGNLSGFSKG